LNLISEKILSESTDERALKKLVTEVYTELKRLAAHHLKNERPNHTLRPTELVHEVYLLLQKQHSLNLNDRVYFVSLASSIMRRVLVNYAKHRNRKKRGEGREKVILDDLNERTLIDFEQNEIDVIALEQSLKELAKLDERLVKIVEMHFYGGLTFEEIAGVLDISLSSVMREWRFTRSWLYQNLNTGGHEK
jgi:RNA polymerase sigma factor (TIGR02999 family)